MLIVLDANVIVPIAVDDQRAPLATRLIGQWLRVGDQLHAPSLLVFEVANALTRLVAAGNFPGARIAEAWRPILALPITYHTLQSDGASIVDLALRLGRQSAYVAAYIALARQLGADLWTFDGPLARNASGLGFPVRLIS